MRLKFTRRSLMMMPYTMISIKYSLMMSHVVYYINMVALRAIVYEVNHDCYFQPNSWCKKLILRSDLN